jgi:hypothetical protein
MEFTEAQTSWRSIPIWASFLIEFGYVWLDLSRKTRMIAVVSMPSDSAAAGLVTLGVMRKYLELDDANDTRSHYEKLLALSRKPTDGLTLRCISRKGIFIFDGIDQYGFLWVKKLRSSSKERFVILPSSALNWRVSGEAPVNLINGQKVPNSKFYSLLVKNGGSIIASNLSASHSKVCLAGRGVGETATKSLMINICFRISGAKTDLSQLLTVQSWLPNTISRVLFYNSRTEQFDRHAGMPQVVIADGDTSFLKVIDAAEFCNSDVIGIVHRTMERDRLEAIGTKLESLRQWYDHAVVCGLPQSPRGVGILVLKRRQ